MVSAALVGNHNKNEAYNGITTNDANIGAGVALFAGTRLQHVGTTITLSDLGARPGGFSYTFTPTTRQNISSVPAKSYEQILIASEK